MVDKLLSINIFFTANF